MPKSSGGYSDPLAHSHSSCIRALPLGITLALAGAATSSPSPASNKPSVPQTWIVKTCDDGGPDSLRDVIENPAKAQSGDIVDLGELPSRCATANSRITLTSGEIAISQQYLTIQGPDPAIGTVTISGSGISRIFGHPSGGALSLYAITVADGFVHAAGRAEGGCIRGSGRVSLHDSVVRSCIVSSDADFALGGGIFAGGDVELVRTLITGNQAVSPQVDSSGGGIFTKSHLSAKYSTISGNDAPKGNYVGPYGYYGGGGAYAQAGANILGSTISGNNSGMGSALTARKNAQVMNSTVSGNTASVNGAVFFTGSAFSIANSTVVFNQQEPSQNAGAVVFSGYTPSATLELQSSIIAANTISSTGGNADVYVRSQGILTGSDNLVIASNQMPPGVITISAPPDLGPLRQNGGPTLTHMLLPGSPALGKGNKVALPPIVTFDQRSRGYPRKSGANGDIDLGAVQFDVIFVNAFDLLF